MQPGPHNAITDVPGILVGHYTDLTHLTGVTVVYPEGGAVAGVDVRGSAPGTRETDLLSPTHLVEKVHAVVLAGGSAFGLEAAGGVMRYLEERGVGYPAGPDIRVPIVPAAVIFDLGVGSARVRPTALCGYRAAQNLRTGPVEQGSVGAGTGARSGGLKGGVGSASVVLEGGLVVGALAVANAHGRAHDPKSGELYARYLELEGEFRLRHPPRPLQVPDYPPPPEAPFHHTVIGCVATNAKLSKAQAQKVAQMAHDGIARAIHPAHTMFDGDTIFCLATGALPLKGPAELSLLGAAAADVFARALVHGILHARSVGGLPSYRRLYEGEED
ncbi:peptidase S58 family protein [Meiothermus sp. QL-1]|uniref:P1 family peptidase n=1 Tax=Meiothermus sp. QL-1 TaxID=2058095 RepID=UPI000E0BDA68|nr:P1 family peptidase [Meiothermus sp. QL-1]RDI96321.1 peptidase S58 family protein [Meiothermus sp. QL-1]